MYEKYLFTTRCGHCFHPRCINEHVNSSDNPVCPLCRGDEGLQLLMEDTTAVEEEEEDVEEEDEEEEQEEEYEDEDYDLDEERAIVVVGEYKGRATCPLK